MDSQLDWTKPITEMVARSLPNLNRSFFLVVDQKYHENRPFFVWAASRADAVECVEEWGKWRGHVE